MLPVIYNLQAEWPEVRITWIIGKLEASLVADLPGVEFIIFDKSQGFSAYRQLRRSLKGRQFDVLLHMQAALRASVASLLIKAPVKIGFDRARAIDWQWLFTNRKIAAVPHQHVLDGFLEFLKALGIEGCQYHWPLVLGKAREEVQAWLPEAVPFIAINPCTSVRARNYREWPVERFAQVIAYVAETYSAKVVLTGGPSEKERFVAEQICATCPVAEVVNLTGQTSLKQLAAVLEQASMMISPDTGPAHIANAVGTPVIGLYATSNPDRTGPYDREYTVNRYPDALALTSQSVDTVRWGKRVRDPEAMSLITVSDVIEKIDELMKGVRHV